MSQVGNRREDVAEGELPAFVRPYDYYKSGNNWWVSVPTPGALAAENRAAVLKLVSHTIEEHDDGTITVTPEIELPPIPNNDPGWKGTLTRGVWEESAT